MDQIRGVVNHPKLENPIANCLIVKKHDIVNRKYVTYEKRLSTYTNMTWPDFKSDFVTKEDLAKAGFYYYGIKDRAVCFYCGVIIGMWESGDIPIVEHALFSNKCLYLLVNKSKVSEESPEEGEVEKTNLCTICMDKERKYVTLPCRHLATCESCITTQDDCPVCRRGIVAIMKVFQ